VLTLAILTLSSSATKASADMPAALAVSR
jgi:hypothetical protein